MFEFDERVLKTPEDVLEASLGGFPGIRMGIKRECMGIFREGVRRWPDYDWRIVLEHCPDAMLISGGIEYLEVERQQVFVNAAAKVNFARRDGFQTPPDDSRLGHGVYFDGALKSEVGYIVANLARDHIAQDQLLQVIRDFDCHRLYQLYGERAKSVEELQWLEPSGLVFFALESFRGDWKPEDLVFAIKHGGDFFSRMELKAEHVPGWERVLAASARAEWWNNWRYMLGIRLEAYKLRHGESKVSDLRVVHQVRAHREDLALVYLSRFKEGLVCDAETACFLSELAADPWACWQDGALEVVESCEGRKEYYGLFRGLKDDAPEELLKLKEQAVFWANQSGDSLGEMESRAKALERLNAPEPLTKPWNSKSSKEIRERIEYLTSDIDGREFYELVCLLNQEPYSPEHKPLSWYQHRVQDAEFWLCYPDLHDRVVASAKAFLGREEEIRCAKEELHQGYVRLGALAVGLVQSYESDFKAGPWSFAVFAEGRRAKFDLDEAERFWLQVPVHEIEKGGQWIYMVRHSKKLRQHVVSSLEDVRSFPVRIAEVLLTYRRSEDFMPEVSELEAFLKDRLSEGKLGPGLMSREYLKLMASTRDGQWLYEQGLWDELSTSQVRDFFIRESDLSVEAVLEWIERVKLGWAEHVSLGFRPDVLHRLRELGRDDVFRSMGQDRFFIYPLISSRGLELWEQMGEEYTGCDEPVFDSWCEEL